MSILMLISPIDEEIKAKIIENLTNYFNDKINNYKEEINYFIVNADKSGLIMNELNVNELLLENFKEIIITELENKYKTILFENDVDYYDTWNNYLILNVINNVPLNENDTYMQQKFNEFYRTFIANLKNKFNFFLMNFITTKIDEKYNSNKLLFNLTKYKNNNNFKQINYCIDRLENYCEDIDDKTRELEKNYKSLSTKINNYNNLAVIMIFHFTISISYGLVYLLL